MRRSWDQEERNNGRGMTCSLAPRVMSVIGRTPRNIPYVKFSTIKTCPIFHTFYCRLITGPCLATSSDCTREGERRSKFMYPDPPCRFLPPPPPSIWPSAAVAAAARLHGLSDNHSESFPPFPSLFLPQPQSHRRKEERHIFLPLLWIWNSAGSPHWSGKEGGIVTCRNLLFFAVIIFSDKKMWVVDGHRNRQNDRYVARSVKDVRPFFKTKNPGSFLSTHSLIFILLNACLF